MARPLKNSRARQAAVGTTGNKWPLVAPIVSFGRGFVFLAPRIFEGTHLVDSTDSIRHVVCHAWCDGQYILQMAQEFTCTIFRK